MGTYHVQMQILQEPSSPRAPLVCGDREPIVNAKPKHQITFESVREMFGPNCHPGSRVSLVKSEGDPPANTERESERDPPKKHTVLRFHQTKTQKQKSHLNET